MKFIEIEGELINLELVQKIYKSSQNKKPVIVLSQKIGSTILPFEDEVKRDKGFDKFGSMLVKDKFSKYLDIL